MLLNNIPSIFDYSQSRALNHLLLEHSLGHPDGYNRSNLETFKRSFASTIASRISLEFLMALAMQIPITQKISGLELI
jgi:hypothetical protein